MGKRKQQKQAPSRPPEFHSTPFSSLKGVQLPVASPAETKPSAPVALPVMDKDGGENLFLLAMEGVSRLGEPPGARLAGDEQTPGLRCSASTIAKAASPAHIEPVASDLFLEEIKRLKLEVKFSDQAPDEDELKPLAGNRLKQLKRGIIAVDHQLDLHGLTRDEALTELPRFLRSARLRGQVAALVITGKGNNSPGEPVLQQAVAGWLRDTGRELVVEYAPAPREMGGSGAFVVFLRPLP